MSSLHVAAVIAPPLPFNGLANVTEERYVKGTASKNSYSASKKKNTKSSSGFSLNHHNTPGPPLPPLPPRQKNDQESVTIHWTDPKTGKMASQVKHLHKFDDYAHSGKVENGDPDFVQFQTTPGGKVHKKQVYDFK
jgi:hypothetical protein